MIWKKNEMENISNKLNVLWFAYSKYFDTVTGTYEKSCT